MAYSCDAQWYPSNFAIGSSNSASRCAWLSGNTKKGVIANLLNIHIRDFTADADIMQQYTDNQARLCQNSARMTFQSGVIADFVPPFFKPPLTYTRAGDPGTSSGGGLVKPDQGIDRARRGYSTNAPKIPQKRGLRFDRRGDGNSTFAGVKNNRPSRLVISNLGHSAKEVCEHHMSLGPDFVSTTEGIYCDMEHAKWWPLCKDDEEALCFDLEKQSLRGSGRDLLDRSVHSIPVKNYALLLFGNDTSDPQIANGIGDIYGVSLS